MAGRAKGKLPGGSLKYKFVYSVVAVVIIFINPRVIDYWS